MKTFEDYCAQSEESGREVLKSAAGIIKAARDLVKASELGDIAKIRKASGDLAQASETVTKAADVAVNSWDITPEEEEELLQEPYEVELLAAAHAADLQMSKQDQHLVVSPSLVKVLPSSKMVQIDKTKLRTLRPKHLVNVLKAHQAKKPRVTPERFIETLHAAYQLVADADSGSTLRRVYDALTLMPDVRKEYSSMDFARDIFALDRSGLKITKSGATLSFPSATGTKNRKDVYSFVSGDGEVISYYGIQFVEANRP